MVTVSIISIIPECLLDDSINNEDGTFHVIPLYSMMMFWRMFFFLMGAALYFGLSWFFNVPDPEDLLHSENFKVLAGAAGRKQDIEMTLVDTEQDEETKPLNISETGLEGRHSPSYTTTRSRKQPQTPKRDLSEASRNKNISLSSGLSAWSKGGDLKSKEQRKAWRVAMLLFISLLIHNFPEGLAVAASALESTSLGITVTIGIMIHNIPEGIAIAVPCLAARPDQPLLAFVLASVSGLAEPAGAFVALIFLRGMKNNPNAIISLENILAFVAGIMIIVAWCELFPEASRNAKETKRYFWYGTITGIIIMTLTELYIPS